MSVPGMRVFAGVGVFVAGILLGVAVFIGARHSPGEPLPVQPSEVLTPSPSDPKLLSLEFNFCLEQDHAFKIEEPLIAGPMPKAKVLTALHELEGKARHQAQLFRNAGFNEIAAMMEAWAEGFAQAQTSVEHGAEPVKAIRAPVKALRPILNAINCEGDA